MNDFDGLSELNHTPEYLMAKFNFYLKLLDLRIEHLAERMKRLGDYRSRPTIVRSLQRMSSGETKATGEILVLLRLLGREFQSKKTEQSLEWTKFQDGSWSAKTSDFALSLHPQSRGRWKVHLVHLLNGYSPPWPAWQDDLESAKKKAIECLCEARLDLKDWEFEEELLKELKSCIDVKQKSASSAKTSTKQ